MTPNKLQSPPWIITKQSKNVTASKEVCHIRGHWFCSENKTEMDKEAEKLNRSDDGFLYFVEHQY